MRALDRMIVKALIALVRVYQIVLSPWIGQQCRFHPTCSNYAVEALTLRGSCTGCLLALGRICRCHPWSAGGFDPVPTESPRKVSTSRVQETDK